MSARHWPTMCNTPGPAAPDARCWSSCALPTLACYVRTSWPWCTAPASGLACRNSGRTGCATRWPVTCCAAAPRWPKSGSCSGTGTSEPPRSTPRWIWTRCAAWPGRAPRRVRCEYAAPGRRGVPGAAPVWWKRRLTVVRGFAAHLKTLDPNCQVPPTGLLPAPPERITPYLYSPDEIAALVHAAGTLARPLQAATYQALISLLAVTGLRAGEAIRLTRDQVDPGAELITVVNSKFGKSRLVPVHPATAGMLRRYAARRDLRAVVGCDRLGPRIDDRGPLLVSSAHPALLPPR